MSANLAQQSSTIELTSIPTLSPMHWTERYFRLVWGSVGIVGCLFCWEIGSSVGVIEPLFVSSPCEVSRTALKLLPSPEFLGDLLVTSECLLLGLSRASVARVLVG